MVKGIFLLGLLAILAGGGGLGVLAYGWLLHPAGSYATTIRYKETLAFEKNNVPVSASGVTEVTLIIGGASGSGTGVVVHLNSAQAIEVNLADGKKLFALPDYPNDDNERPLVLYDACQMPKVERSQDVALLRSLIDQVTLIKGSCVVPEENWPILIYFKDVNDPYSAERILPQELEAEFGGLKLDRVTVQLTSESPSTGIEASLPWLSGGMTKGPVPIRTVEKHPRSNPIELSKRDFVVRG